MMAVEVASNEVEILVSGLWNTSHHLQTAGESLGLLVLPAFRRGGVFHSVDGRELVAERTRWWRRWHELREGAVVLGSAAPRAIWGWSLEVMFGSQAYVLEPAGILTRAWRLLDERGDPLLEISPRGIFRRGAVVTILAEVPVDLVAFTYYLVFTRWQEQAAATAAAS